MDVKEEAALGRTLDDHWYYLSKGAALEQMLQGLPVRTVLDIGAGSGVFSKRLLRGAAASATCVDPAYAEPLREETIGGKPLRFVREITTENADLILLMDVLEHVDDDVDLLRSAMRGAAPHAHVLITVPAFQRLYSAHDVFLDHKRRYSLRQLEHVVHAAGLEVVRSRYFFALLLPVAIAFRLMEKRREPRSNLRVHAPLVNTVAYYVQRLELPLLRFNRLAGLSVFCLARLP